MRKTPKQIADLPVNSGEKRQWLLEASAREIQQFIHLIADNPYCGKEYELARTALDIRLAEDADVAAQNLVLGTDHLVTQTEKLVKFTQSLVYLTVILAILALLEFLKFFFKCL
jgi:hypothetical protein